MAQQAVRKQAETHAPRRRSARLPVAETGTKPIDYAGWRLTINNPDQFMDFMRGYPNPQGVTLFLYRLLPKIDLSLIGLEETNLQKGGIEDLPLYSLEAVAEKWGRGKYNLRVTDSNRPDGQRQVIQTCPYKLLDVEKPPVYDVRTLLLGHSDNIDEVNRQVAMGVLVRDTAGAPRLRSAADGAVNSAAPVAVAPGPAYLGNDLLLQFAIESLKSARQSPTEQLKDSIEIAKLMRPPESALPSIDAIADAVATRLGGGAPRGGGDVFANWEKVQSFIERAGGVVSSANPAPAAAAAVGDGSGWAPYLASILAEARAFLPEVVGAWNMMKNQRNAPGEQPKTQTGVPMLPLNQRIETIFKTGYQCIQNGVSGEQFAAWLCMSGEFAGGLEAFNFLKPGGVTGLITMAATNPVGAQIVNDAAIRPQLEAFLTSFFSFDPVVAASS